VSGETLDDDPEAAADGASEEEAPPAEAPAEEIPAEQAEEVVEEAEQA